MPCAFRPAHRRHRSLFAAFAVLVLLACSAISFPRPLPRRTSFRIAWSIYVGWMPWDYGADAGIVKKWADKYGIKIEVVQINDYVESINQYTVGRLRRLRDDQHGRAHHPAAGGVDSTALIVGDFSNGNDGIVLKGKECAGGHQGPEGQSGGAVACRITCWRARCRASGLSEQDITVVNTSDADIVAA